MSQIPYIWQNFFNMNTNMLLPHSWKKIGWIILVPSVIAGIFLIATDYEADWLSMKVFAIFNDSIFEDDNSFAWVTANVSNTITGIGFLVGAMLVAFSGEKVEDEYIARLRLSSLLWAVWVNYLLLLFAFIFVYGIAFLHVMIFNMFTVLIIFIVRFNYQLFKNAKSIRHEEQYQG